ncbi:MAG TPA: hypothetical protein VIL71_08390 [Spirillospora sp.]
MHGDLGALYDAHAHRLYAHCWSLLGDQGAAGALRETLNRAMRSTPRGETVLWLHRLARAVCAERGAFDRRVRPVFAQAATDPLLDAVANLSAGHREALLLSAGQWLEVRDIAQVLEISQSRVNDLLHQASTALENFVLDVLIRGNADPGENMDVIAAFEKGRLPNLLARRAATWAPAPLRDQVLADADREDDEANGAANPDDQLVVINSAAAAERERARRRKAVLKGVGGVTGVAATVAAGLVMTWPTGDSGTLNALGPHEGTRPGPVPSKGTGTPGSPTAPDTGRNSEAPKPPAPAPTTKERAPVTDDPTLSGGGGSGAPSSKAAPSSRSADPSITLERQTPSTSPSTSPSRPQSPPPQQSPQPSPEQQKPRPHNPIKPVTDLVGHLTSPILGGLAGR